MVAEFIKYYGYSASGVLAEFARTFFSLMNEKVKLESKERINLIENITIARGTNPNGEKVVQQLFDKSEGVEKYIKAAKTLREARDV